jgi:TRAP-type C4-dicarboxylate transport system permease small subunit
MCVCDKRFAWQKLCQVFLLFHPSFPMFHRFSHAFSAVLAAGAALMLVCVLLVQLAGIGARFVGMSLPAADAYAGYCLAGASFFAMGAALYKGDHIRVTLLLQKLAPAWRYQVELLCLLVATGLCAYFTWFAGRLVWQSYAFQELSNNLDATPMWIPQLSMVLGMLGLLLAFTDLLFRTWQSGRLVESDSVGNVMLE